MDSRFKGIGWVGGIYQKFETLCHEMDNIVNQDTVKYVENQAQSVGKSMKRFYSDVMLPLKHDAKGVALKRSTTIGTSFESKVAEVDPIEKRPDHASNELFHSVQLSIPASVDAFDGADSDKMSPLVSDVMKTTSSDVSRDENAIRKMASRSDVPELISQSEDKFIDMEFQSPKRETRVSDNTTVDEVNKQLECEFGEICHVDQPGNLNSVDSLLGKQYVTSEQVAGFLNGTKPEVNPEEHSTMEKHSASMVSGLLSPFEKESSGSSMLSKFIDCNEKEMPFEAEVPPSTSVQDVRKPSVSDVSESIFPGEEESFGASMLNEIVNCDDEIPSVVQSDVSSATLVQGDQNERKDKNDRAGVSDCVSDASGDVTSYKMTSSGIRSEEVMAEVGVVSPCGSVLKEIYFPEKNSLEHSPAKALISHDPINVAELTVPISSGNDLSMASPENDAYRTANSPKSLTEISGSKNVYFGGEPAQIQALSLSNIGPINDSTDDINISSMETVELYDEVKLEDSCHIPDVTALYAVSHIMNKHKSYKKRIKDALTSKKRLVKEYEQLAIWFGDADMGSDHNHFQTPQPSSSTATSKSKNTQTELVCDSDWELL
ncbi:hypothetical protein ES332_D05G400300v1 [Gossypium tomentosum]|uniref:Uncharacterized protein n=1 Tax=Gossypium tomentosum TaxID=34277 RepID=A0A5D2L5C5_GOSTO|nr:hypothetical protein ES332_D05G400300v1 [Gossypium tomentosum]